MSREIEIPMPDDLHVHFRQGEMLQMVVPHTARQFGRAVVMPNLRPKPVLTDEDAVAYRAEIMTAVPAGSSFEPLMTIQITEETTPHQIIVVHKAGVIAGKIYPRGVTTHSDNGVNNYRKLFPVYDAMQTCGMVLSLHGESPDPQVEGLAKETEFLKILREIGLNFPNLRIVLEHITTKAAIDFVTAWTGNIAATITLLHLILTLDDVIGYSVTSRGLMQPHHYCKPIAKMRDDRQALLMAATGGNPKFFFGSDSAPHLRRAKECADCCAGIFTAPVIMPMLMDIFADRRETNSLAAFTSIHGADFYHLSRNKGRLLLREEAWRVPDSYPVGDDVVIPFMAGRIIPWQVV